MSFDRFARDYRAEVDRAAGVSVERLAGEKARLILDVLSAHLGDPKRLRVLDIGCGIGLVDRELEGEVGLLCAADMSRDSLDLAKTRAPATRFALYDGTSLPFADASFDAAFAVSVVHHVPPNARRAFMAEMLRPVVPRGIAILIEHNPLNPITRRIVSRCAFDADAVLLGCREAGKLLAFAGAPMAGRRYIGFSPVRNALVERAERGIAWLPIGAQYCAWGIKRAGHAAAARDNRMQQTGHELPGAGT
jgi:SAM-dependent methyltransferase